MSEIIALMWLSQFNPSSALSAIVPAGCAESRILSNLRAVNQSDRLPISTAQVTYEARLSRGETRQIAVLGTELSFKNPSRQAADLYLIVGADSHADETAWGVLADPKSCRILRARALL